MAHKKTSLLRGSATMFLSLAISGGTAVIMSIVVARIVGASEFGTYAIVISVQNIVVLFAGFSIGTSLSKFVAEYRMVDRNEALRLAKVGFALLLLFSFISCLAYVSLADPIGIGIYHEIDVALLIPFSALVVFSSAFLYTTFGIVQGCQNIRLLSLMQIGSSILSFALVISLVLMIGVAGLFLGLFVSQFSIAAVGTLLIGREGFPFLARRGRFLEWKLARKLLGFSFPAFLSALVGVPMIWFGVTELSLKSGLEAVGSFATAAIIYQALIMIPQAISIPLVPRVSQIAATSPGSVDSAVSPVVKVLSVFLFPIVFGIALFSRPVVLLLFGPSYASASDVIYLMMATSYFYCLASVLGAVIVGSGRMWLNLGLNVIWALVFFVSVVLAVPNWGILGLGLAYVVSYGVNLGATYYASSAILKIHIRSVYFPTLLVIAFFSVGFLLSVHPLSVGWVLKALLLCASTAFLFWVRRNTIRIHVLPLLQSRFRHQTGE